MVISHQQYARIYAFKEIEMTAPKAIGLAMLIGVVWITSSMWRENQILKNTTVNNNRVTNTVPKATSKPVAPTPTPAKQLTFEDYESVAIKNLTYDDLFRENEKYVEKVVWLKGEVTEVQTQKDGMMLMRLSITQNKYDNWENPILVAYEGSRFLEDDIVEIVGQVKGVESYESVMGANITIPAVYAHKVQLITKAGDRVD